MAQLTVRIDEDLKGHLQTLARQEGKSTSDVVRSLVQRYVRDRDRGAALRDLWKQMQKRAEETEAGREDIEGAIASVREKVHAGENPVKGSRSEPAGDRP
ncbi:ribbon-helix-helix protein, CopG family [Salinibacter ruber]|jgi:predicted transcriptional regulator|uniref:Transcriptional regulator n=1 Tax=Salinibacter ruber TaxID=146919 RepID=A0A9X2TIG5_9BACT|nr:ribbon-helix-helix protein, CopG family [Salinibacter ruber]MCS3658358.1 putative transcriptional regulator [Salinibacter ruber]MCS3661537.1 putative transcriptional regulator [Salinibacter ruber]MCS3711236.1 putative transcriptional regulator [Salinibacter ruber]